MRALCDAPYVVVMSLSALSLACLASLSQPDLQQQRDRPGREVHEFVALGGGEAGEGLFEPFDRGQANGGYGLFAFFGEHGLEKSRKAVSVCMGGLPFVRLASANVRLA